MATDTSSTHVSRKKNQKALEDAKRYLELLSQKFIETWDLKSDDDYDFLRKYGSTDFTMHYPRDKEMPLNITTTMEAHIEQCEVLKRINPSWTMGAYNFTAVLDVELENASVWFTSAPSGGPGSTGEWATNRESVSKLSWRRREDGEWECYAHLVIRGGGLAVPTIP